MKKMLFKMKKKPAIAFIGIDGSGKTTLIERFGKKLDENGKKYKVIYMGLGRDIQIPFLKELMEFYARIRYGGIKKKDYHRSRDNLRERGPLWLLVQYIEFWVRYIKAKKYSKDHIIIFDRFFYDGLILGSDLSFNIFRFLTPRPDKCFLIRAPPEVIRKRKKEAEIKEIIKYYKKAERLARHFKVIDIDNTKQIDVVVSEIYSEIFKNRTKQKRLFEFLNKNKIKYVVLRGYKEEDMEKGKDLDILILKKDYDMVVDKGHPRINRVVHFYPDKEKHFGITFLNKASIYRREFDSGRGFFVLSKKDKLRMGFFRGILKIGRNTKKFLGLYKK